MTQSAAVVAPAPLDLAAMLDRWVAAWSVAPIDWLRDIGRRIADRILAKFAYHDARRYRELICRAAAHADPVAARAAGFSPAGTSPAARQTHHATLDGSFDSFVREVRKLDPGGLGVWYLAHTPRELDLVGLCRRALAAPHSGPPRAVARWLGHALTGDPIWWSLHRYWFDVLASRTLIYSAVGAAQAARDLTGDPEPTQFTAAQSNLLAAANSLQTVARAYARAFDEPTRAGPDAAALAYQAINGLRRLMNQTDLTAADEQLAEHAARLAVQTSQAACSTVLAITSKQLPQPPDSHGVRERLAALARSVDALASRVASSTGGIAGSRTNDPWTTQVRRVLAATSAALPNPAPSPPADRSGPAHDPRADSLRSDVLAEASAETLDAWAWIHEWSDLATEDNPGNPPYVTDLVGALTGKLPTRAIIAAVRGLTATGERSVPAAACVAALCRGPADLGRELWRLIQSGDSSAGEKSLAFQLWRRLDLLRPAARNVGEAT